MPVSFEFLRGVLGLMGVACAYMAGRSSAAVRRGWHKSSRLYAWLIRTAVCLGAIVFRHPVDEIAIGVWAASAVAFGAAWWQTSRQRPAEDVTEQIFPHDS